MTAFSSYSEYYYSEGITTGTRNITKGIAGALKIMSGMIIVEEQRGDRDHRRRDRDDH